MKKNVFRLAAAALALLLMVTVLPLQASAAEEGTVYVTVSQQGELAKTKDGAVAARLPVHFTGESATVDAVLKTLHTDYCAAGAEGYATAQGDYGVSMTRLWGESDGVGAFYVNGSMPWDTVDVAKVQSGDVIDLILYRTDWSDSYASFSLTEYEAVAGKEVTLTLRRDSYDESYNMSQVALAGAKILTGEKSFTDTGLVTDEDGKVTLTFDQVGTYLVTATSDTAITAPVCRVTVTKAAIPAYTDVAGKWFSSAVNYVSGQGYFGGTSADPAAPTFSPNATMTRGMLVTVLWRMAGEPVVDYAMDLSDVGESYYTEAVRWAASLGIVNGYDDGRFGPNDPVQRQQLAAFLSRYAEKVLKQEVSGSAGMAGFSDADQISSYAYDAMTWAVGAKLLQGSDGKLLPAKSATRAEVAAILMRFDALA